jgi:hypothetical protein
MPEVTKLREGFVRDRDVPLEPPAEPLPPETEPPIATPPQEPLPSQLKSEQPVPEPPLSGVEELRKEIVATADAWPITVQLLYKPIHDPTKGELKALTFREPRASEINRIGNPTRMLWDGEIIIEERKMTYIMGALSGVLPPVIDTMDPRDWNSCAYRLRKFFLPDLRAW